MDGAKRLVAPGNVANVASSIAALESLLPVQQRQFYLSLSLFFSPKPSLSFLERKREPFIHHFIHRLFTVTFLLFVATQATELYSSQTTTTAAKIVPALDKKDEFRPTEQEEASALHHICGSVSGPGLGLGAHRDVFIDPQLSQQHW